MKKIIVLALFCAIANRGYSQALNTETQKLATLCKVWGFLKYYHPHVANGKFDWDAELIKKIPQIKSAQTKEEINTIYADWIDGLGEIKKQNFKRDTVGLFLKNFDLNWINDFNLFDKQLIEKLNYIKENRAQGNVYVFRNEDVLSFENENPYKDSISPSESLRIVSLFRYWNIINYHYPYKYLIGENWDNLLLEMIPKFIKMQNASEYELGLIELVARINDTHGFFVPNNSTFPLGKKGIPALFKIIDNKALVLNCYNDSLFKNDLQIGDIILKYNNRDVSELISERIKYISGSNEPTKLRNINKYIFHSSSDSALITFERNNKIISKKIKCFSDIELKNKYTVKNPLVCKNLTDSIGYINMGVLLRTQVDSVMKLMMNKKAIIFDLRNYPKGTAAAISDYLNKEIVPFVKITIQDTTMPGVFYFSATYFAGDKSETNWFLNRNSGKPNVDYFKGKVVLLINEETQSQAEYTCMALQTAPNVICIGSQTAGADGNIAKFILPGGHKTWFTGSGVYFPDGRETQRIGIVPDIEVKPTIEGIKLGKDEVLERAILYINTGK